MFVLGEQGEKDSNSNFEDDSEGAYDGENDSEAVEDWDDLEGKAKKQNVKTGQGRKKDVQKRMR